MEKIRPFNLLTPVLIFILISTVMAKDLRLSNSDNENHNEVEIEQSPKLHAGRQGRTFFNLFRQPYYPPPPPFVGGSLPIIPPYYHPRPNPVWAAVHGAGSFIMDMFHVVTSAVAQMHFNGGPYYGGGDYDGGGDDYSMYEGGGGGDDSWFGGGDGGGYDDSSSDDGGDYRSLPMPPQY